MWDRVQICPTRRDPLSGDLQTRDQSWWGSTASLVNNCLCCLETKVGCFGVECRVWVVLGQTPPDYWVISKGSTLKCAQCSSLACLTWSFPNSFLWFLWFWPDVLWSCLGATDLSWSDECLYPQKRWLTHIMFTLTCYSCNINLFNRIFIHNLLKPLFGFFISILIIQHYLF